MDALLRVQSGIGRDRFAWEHISHRVFTLHARPQAIEDPHDTDFVFHFKSHHAQTLFEEELKTASWLDLQSVLSITSKFTMSRSLEGNIFEGVVHNILPGLEPMPLRLMKEVCRGDKFITYDVNGVPSILKLHCRRSFRCHFTTTSPLDIDFQTYYQAARNTPLIDGFIVHQEGGRWKDIILYFFQITVSQHKKNTAPSGADLVARIVENVRATRKKKIKIAFVMIQPAFGHTIDKDVRWELPILSISGCSSYAVYRCTLSLPTSPPSAVVTLDSLVQG